MHLTCSQPLYHSLPNALEISSKTILTSRLEVNKQYHKQSNFLIIFRKLAIKTLVGNFLLIVYPLFYEMEQYYFFFKTSGKCPDAKQFSKSKVSGLHNEGTHSLSIFTEISSSP